MYNANEKVLESFYGQKARKNIGNVIEYCVLYLIRICTSIKK